MTHAPARLATLDARRARRAEWLRPRLDALPRPYQGGTFDERVAARAAYMAQLAALKAEIEAHPDRPRLTDTGTQARVTMLGLTSTSTGGLAAALRNWITRATT